MSISNFKKEALELNRSVYEVRKYKNKHGEGYKVVYAAVLQKDAYGRPIAVSVQQERFFHECTLGQILSEWAA